MIEKRRRMVDEQLVARHIRDPRVLEVMGRVPRHRFAPEEHADKAYGDHPVAIGAGQTLSQPYIVALMTELLELTGSERVLEIGTGSGYQTAILAELARRVFTVELVPELAAEARARLLGMGYDNISYRVGDGRDGWPDESPFEAILVAAAPLETPVRLREQLAPGGRLVIPVGAHDAQQLELHVRGKEGFEMRRFGAVRFVPLV